jgi:hypothetical protein
MLVGTTDPDRSMVATEPEIRELLVRAPAVDRGRADQEQAGHLRNAHQVAVGRELLSCLDRLVTGREFVPHPWASVTMHEQSLCTGPGRHPYRLCSRVVQAGREISVGGHRYVVLSEIEVGFLERDGRAATLRECPGGGEVGVRITREPPPPPRRCSTARRAAEGTEEGEAGSHEPNGCALPDLSVLRLDVRGVGSSVGATYVLPGVFPGRR